MTSWRLAGVCWRSRRPVSHLVCGRGRARANGIDGRSLNAWRVNLARRESRVSGRQPRSQRAAVGVRLVELVPTPSSRPESAGVARYVLDVGGGRVEFGDDFREETLARVMMVLRAC